MRRTFLSVILAFIAFSASAQQYPEASFNPSSQWYDMNVSGTLTLWGVPETGGLELKADPNAGASKFAIATCAVFLEDARKEGIRVGIGYDPGTRAIVYCGKPRS